MNRFALTMAALLRSHSAAAQTPPPEQSVLYRTYQRLMVDRCRSDSTCLGEAKHFASIDIVNESDGVIAKAYSFLRDVVRLDTAVVTKIAPPPSGLALAVGPT